MEGIPFFVSIYTMDLKIQPKLSKLDFPHSPLLQYIWHHKKLPTEPTKPRPLTRTHKDPPFGGTLWDGPVASQPDAESRKPTAGNWRHLPRHPPGTTKPKESPPRKLKNEKTYHLPNLHFMGFSCFCGSDFLFLIAPVMKEMSINKTALPHSRKSRHVLKWGEHTTDAGGRQDHPKVAKMSGHRNPQT